METTRTLQQELNERWLTLDGETQECIMYLVRMFTGERSLKGLPLYQEALERQDRGMAEKYTTFGQLAVGDRFTWFGNEYEKTEPDKVPLWINCRGPGGERYLSDSAAVEKAEDPSAPEPAKA